MNGWSPARLGAGSLMQLVTTARLQLNDIDVAGSHSTNQSSAITDYVLEERTVPGGYPTAVPATDRFGTFGSIRRQTSA
jgi:hypothetical protein